MVGWVTPLRNYGRAFLERCDIRSKSGLQVRCTARQTASGSRRAECLRGEKDSGHPNPDPSAVVGPHQTGGQSFRRRDFQDRFGAAKAAHADTCERLPLKAAEGRAAVVTLRNPVDGEFSASFEGPGFSKQRAQFYVTLDTHGPKLLLYTVCYHCLAWGIRAISELSLFWRR